MTIQNPYDHSYIHVDFQLTHTSDCLRRFFVYNGMLTELKKPYPIYYTAGLPAAGENGSQQL